MHFLRLRLFNLAKRKGSVKRIRPCSRLLPTMSQMFKLMLIAKTPLNYKRNQRRTVLQTTQNGSALNLLQKRLRNHLLQTRLQRLPRHRKIPDNKLLYRPKSVIPIATSRLQDLIHLGLKRTSVQVPQNQKVESKK